MKILERAIGAGHRPYLIAEMSGNHNQSLERALADAKEVRCLGQGEEVLTISRSLRHSCLRVDKAAGTRHDMS